MPKGTINKFEVIGRLGKNPKVLKGSNDKKFVAFSVATNGDFKLKNGEKMEHTDWHQFLAFGHLAEFAEKYLIAGKRVYVQSIIKTRVEETEQGKRGVSTNIVRQIELLDSFEQQQHSVNESVYDEEEIEPDVNGIDPEYGF